MYKEILKELRSLEDPEKAEFFPRFFKTGKGEYGEGDKFLGVTVPQYRSVAKKYFNDTTLSDLQRLIENPLHEVRACALVILVLKYKKSNESKKEELYNFYLKNTKFINNWDLVDMSAYKIMGPFLENRDRKVLYTLSDLQNLWEQRIAIMTTMYFIKSGDFKDALFLSKKYLAHQHDLIHKATGWMLREIEKMDVRVLEKFLNKHYKEMPRTMLRYATEKMPPKRRHKYLKGMI